MLTGSWIITRRRPDAFVGRADSLIKGGECSKRSQDDYTNWPNGVNFKVHCNWSCVTCRMRCSGRDSELNRGQSGFFYILHASYLQSGGTGSWERAWGFIENIILFSGWVPIGVHTCMHHIRPKAEEDWSHVFFDYGSTIHRPFLYFHFDMII